MSQFFGILVILCLVNVVVFSVLFVLRWIMKKPKKKQGIVLLSTIGALILFTIFGVFTDPATLCKHEWEIVNELAAACTENGKIESSCPLCGSSRTKTIKATGHNMVESARIEPTIEHEGQIIYKCSNCGYEEIVAIPVLESGSSEITDNVEPTTVPNEETTPPPSPDNSIATNKEEQSTYTEGVTFADIYRSFKSNELVAKEEYNGNRYRITGKINGMETGDLFNLTGGATLTMEIQVDNTIVFFYAEFEKEQENNLRTIIVGDTITFDGECWGGNFSNCEMVVN